MQITSRPIGGHLREWRQRRHLSQLALACDAEISTKHLSFIETGRSSPSREMVLLLAERLEIPLRDRNLLLVAAGMLRFFPRGRCTTRRWVPPAESSTWCWLGTNPIQRWRSTTIGR